MEIDFNSRDSGSVTAKRPLGIEYAQLGETPPPRKNQEELDKFASIDHQKQINSADTVFVGSSTFAWWNSLEDDFKEEHAINRAIGGTTVKDIDENLDDLVLKYNPHKVVVYSGINDLARGREPEQVQQDVEQLERKIHDKLPNAELYVLAPSESPQNKHLAERYRQADDLIRNYLAKRPHSHFVDTPKVMHDTDGSLRNDLFLPDNTHPNKRGYDEVLKPLIKQALRPVTGYGGSVMTRQFWL